VLENWFQPRCVAISGRAQSPDTAPSLIPSGKTDKLSPTQSGAQTRSAMFDDGRCQTGLIYQPNRSVNRGIPETASNHYFTHISQHVYYGRKGSEESLTLQNTASDLSYGPHSLCIVSHRGGAIREFSGGHFVNAPRAPARAKLEHTNRTTPSPQQIMPTRIDYFGQAVYDHSLARKEIDCHAAPDAVFRDVTTNISRPSSTHHFV